ncbi:hypothetical protein pb186bvf_007939 [Paramecium bursaria]
MSCTYRNQLIFYELIFYSKLNIQFSSVLVFHFSQYEESHCNFFDKTHSKKTYYQKFFTKPNILFKNIQHMLILCLCKLILAMPQLNPIQNQFFYQQLDNLFDTNGFSMQVSPIQTLGFQIQGGLLSSPFNPYSILNDEQPQSQILSTSLSQFGEITILNLAYNYYLLTLQLNYSGQISQQQLDLNFDQTIINCSQLSSTFINIIHCYFKNGQVMLYIQNQSSWTQYNTTLYLNNTNSLFQISIQQFKQMYDGIRITLIYYYQSQTLVYWSLLNNNIISAFQQLCNLNQKYIQVISTIDNSIFALQDNLILYICNNTQSVYYNQQSSNYIAFQVEQFSEQEYFIYAATNKNLGLIYLNQKFKLLQIQDFGISTTSAQVFKSLDSVLVITDRLVFYYQQNENILKLKYFEQINLYSALNLYESSSKSIFYITSGQLQVYQFQNFFLYTELPQSSGMIQLLFYDVNQTLQNQESVQINVLPEYNNQILSTEYQFNNFNLSYQSQNYIKVPLSKQFIGPNITFTINSTDIEGFNSIVSPFNFDVRLDDYCYIYPLSYINSFLLIAVTNSQLQFYVNRYSYSYNNVQSSWKFDFSMNQTVIQAFQIIEDYNNQYLIIILTENSILVYQVIPLMTATFLYTINVTSILNENQYILVNSFIKGSILFIQTSNQLLLIDINGSRFKVMYQSDSNYTFISSNDVKENILFASSLNQLLIIQLYDDFTFDMINQIELFEYQEGFSLYAFPVLDGLFVTYTNGVSQQVVLYSMNNIMQVNLGQQYFYSIDTANFTFNSSRMASSFEVFLCSDSSREYFFHQYIPSILSANKFFILIDLSWGIIIDTKQLYDIQNQLDYLIVQTNTNFYLLYQIYYQITNYISPNISPLDQYFINNTLEVNNSYFSQQFQLFIDIQQPQIEITQNQQFSNITGLFQSWINGTLFVNPYEYFNGIIESYTVQCADCSQLDYQPILNDNYYYYDQITYFSILANINDTTYLVLSNQMQITLFEQDNYSNQSNNMTEAAINLITYPNEEYQVHLLFIEVYSGSLSWLLGYKTSVYVCSYINNTIVNITLNNITGVLNQANYQNGIIQLGMSNSYSCLYYYIQDNVNFVTYITTIQTSGLLLFRNPFINVTQQEQNSIFGTIMQDETYTLFILIVNCTFNSYQNITFNNYKIEYLSFLNEQNYPFHIQSILTFGENIYDGDFISIHLVYTTSLVAKTIRMIFKGMSIQKSLELCNLFVINATINSNYQNFLSIYNNQLAILNEYPYEGKSIIYLSFYIIDTNLCQAQIQPYSFVQLQNNYTEDIIQVNYVSEQNIVISFNSNTTIYQVSKYVQISYQTQQNSTINMIALNNVSNSTQNIYIQFMYIPDEQETTLAIEWYWIVSVSLMIIIFLLIIFLIIKAFHRKDDPPQKRELNQLEINFINQ